MLQVGGVRLSRYQTLYFDTPSLDLYARHQAGHAERFKVRSRCYVDSGLSFFEIKRKTNKGRTVKSRLQTATFWNRPTSEARRYLDDLGVALEELEPILANQFTRITLVGRQRPERVTIDLGLRFRPDGYTPTWTASRGGDQTGAHRPRFALGGADAGARGAADSL